jgi:hypothetical protein
MHTTTVPAPTHTLRPKASALRLGLLALAIAVLLVVAFVAGRATVHRADTAHAPATSSAPDVALRCRAGRPC